jgi:hypothetical protein
LHGEKICPKDSFGGAKIHFAKAAAKKLINTHDHFHIECRAAGAILLPGSFLSAHGHRGGLRGLVCGLFILRTYRRSGSIATVKKRRADKNG